MNVNFKKDFPLLSQLAHGKPLVYLDSSNSSQKPACVIEAMANFYQHDYANIHRAVYELGERATQAFETTRQKIKNFIHAKHAHEIIFVKGATEGINLVAQTFGRSFFKPNDEVIISTMEHHANIVPWQLLATQIGIKLKIIPINDRGEIDLVAYENLFSPHTKMVAISHASNVLGTINPIKTMIESAHSRQIPVLIDGAQAFPHLSVNVVELDCDFYVFSSHKAYGPTGVGVLYGKTEFLEKMPPYQGGGDMIENVTFEKTTFNLLPYKFEAGTPNIAGVVGWSAALDYLTQIGMENVFVHEQALLNYANTKLLAMEDLIIIGNATNKLGVISFVMPGIHAHDVGTVLDHEGIAVRVGSHCAMPLMQRFAIPACVRASFGIYNSMSDVDALVAGLQTVRGCLADV